MLFAGGTNCISQWHLRYRSETESYYGETLLGFPIILARVLRITTAFSLRMVDQPTGSYCDT